VANDFDLMLNALKTFVITLLIPKEKYLAATEPLIECIAALSFIKTVLFVVLDLRRSLQ
jgi:hypothetical protein